LLFGILLGDGCLSCYKVKERKSTKKVIVFTGHKQDDKEFYELILIPLLRSLTDNSVKLKERNNVNVIEIHLFDITLFNRISALGFPVGKKGIILEIPIYFYEKDLIRYIVQGFIATDRSLVITRNPNKFYPRIEGNGIFPKLIKQISDHLNSIGMGGYFYEAKRVSWNDQYNRQQPYRFQFNGVKNLLLFERLIGFVNPKHYKKFLKFLEYS